MRQKAIITLGILLLIVVCIASITRRDSNLEQSTQQTQNSQELIGRIGEGYFNFEIADTIDKRQQGLSGKDALADTDAMVFVFNEPGNHCFWMKDMKFSIDMLWFDADKKLVYEKRDVSPDTYPQSFCPDKPAQYVVEVTSGVADKNQIQLGDSLDIEL